MKSKRVLSKQNLRRIALGLLVIAAWFGIVQSAAAHHILGRPAYNLNEDSNTPPSMQVETQIGDFFVTYMVYPAFPRPGEPGRVHLYASRIGTGEPLQGEVSFSVRDDGWFAGQEELLGVQPVDDNVFRQSFQFHTDGDYIISASFNADGHEHVIDFPLHIGDHAPIGPIVITAVLILAGLVAINVFRRKRVLRETISDAHRADAERYDVT